MVATEDQCQIPRSILAIINNVHVINNCQQAFAARTLSRAQFAMISHPGSSLNANCTPPGLIISVDMELILMWYLEDSGMDLLRNNGRR